MLLPDVHQSWRGHFLFERFPRGAFECLEGPGAVRLAAAGVEGWGSPGSEAAEPGTVEPDAPSPSVAAASCLPAAAGSCLPTAAAARTCMPAALPLAPFPPEAFAAGAFPRAFAAGALPTGAAAGWANSKRPISGPYFLASLA